jgi:hypothetical protein
LVDRIDALVPRIPSPRAHQVRYHGILAPAASLPSRVVHGPGSWYPTSNQRSKRFCMLAFRFV